MPLQGKGGWNKGQTFPPEPLTVAEVRALVQACSATSSLGLRNRALIATLYGGGLRISEALALRPKDVDVAAGSIRVLRGKGSRDRVVGLDPGSVATLARWLDRRASLGINGRQAVFCDLSGAPIKAPGVRMLLKRLADKAGIEKRVHPHGLRHTLAAELYRDGVPLPTIQRQLGHASLDGTAHYLGRISPQDVIDAMQSRQGALS